MNGFHNNLNDLEYLIKDNTPVVLAIQEVHRSNVNSMNRTLGGRYSWVYKSNANIYHSVAIGILEPIAFSVIQLDTDLPIIAVRIEYPFPVSIISIYLPCQKIPDLKNRLLLALEPIQGAKLILGDINGHHTSWGNSKVDSRGATIMEVAEMIDLVLLNDGSITFTKGERRSSVDISLASSCIVNRLLWNISEDPLGSDHHPISICLHEQPPETSRRPRWIYNEADWTAFQTTINESLTTSEQENLSEFLSIVHQAATTSIPKTSSKPGRKALPWWSPETKRATKARRKALRAMLRLPDGHPEKLTAKDLYKSKRNECRQIIRDAKRLSFENFLDGINSNQSSSELWGRVNALSGKRKARGMAIHHNGALTRDLWIFCLSFCL
ncbi:hypothetical protein RP20_CCG024026 [Aedes albopictus]|nr:hypothetical protein RP20_CCG024026 [Aedes albopictus]